jgi:hypothetical protein
MGGNKASSIEVRDLSAETAEHAARTQHREMGRVGRHTLCRLSMALRGLVTATLLAAAPCASATAGPAAVLQDLLEDTRLLGIVEIDPHRDRLREARGGGYELSQGRFVSFDRWYRRRWPDLRVDFMSRVTDNAAFLWGVSTGEYGEKYSVSPSIRIGLLVQARPSPSSTVSLVVTTAFGGRLGERPCVADYGQIGGVQTVNCRLAASVLEPGRTLDLLWREKAPDQTRVTLRYQLSF